MARDKIMFIGGRVDAALYQRFARLVPEGERSAVVRKLIIREILRLEKKAERRRC